MDVSQNHAAICDMDLKPACHELGLLAVGKVVMIWVHHLDPMGIPPHPEVVFEVLEDNLDHHVAVCFFLGGNAGMDRFQQLARLRCVVLLFSQFNPPSIELKVCVWGWVLDSDLPSYKTRYHFEPGVP